jgi:hypothetical protein
LGTRLCTGACMKQPGQLDQKVAIIVLSQLQLRDKAGNGYR